MIRKSDDKQLTFLPPFGGQLQANNRWVQLANVVPWDDLEPAYNAVMCKGQGRPSKPARLVIGAMIIKHKLKLSDEEAVLQIQENAYLQYFCGFVAYVDAVPFVPSLFVEIRKRMGKDMFEQFEQGIVNKAVSMQKYKRQVVDDKEKNTTPADDKSTTTSASDDSQDSHQGRLLMDATVADQMIRFPTDLSLLNQAREIAEELIDILHKNKIITGKKPRTYRQEARKAYLNISKRKRAGGKLIRKGIRQQLQYVKRDLGHIEKMLDICMPNDGMPFPLAHKHQRKYWIIKHLYAQQQQMHQDHVRRCDDRIISISQPHVRPIVRGKAGTPVEFGSKINVSLVGKLAFVDHLSWDAFNESQDLIGQVEAYYKRFGFYPEVVHADGIYGTRINRKWLKDKGIRFAGKPLGRPRKKTNENKAELLKIKRQQRADECLRIPIEGKFGQGKNGYQLNQIRAKLASTSEAWVRGIFLVMNLVALIKFLLPAPRIQRFGAMLRCLEQLLSWLFAPWHHLSAVTAEIGTLGQLKYGAF